MKLLYCPSCLEVFSLDYTEKKCKCGKTKGKYIDDLYAEYEGGIPLGFNNHSFIPAVSNQSKYGMGEKFEAFIIPENCRTFKEREGTK